MRPEVLALTQDADWAEFIVKTKVRIMSRVHRHDHIWSSANIRLSQVQQLYEQ